MQVFGIVKLVAKVCLCTAVATAQAPPSLKTVPVPQPDLVALGYQHAGPSCSTNVVSLAHEESMTFCRLSTGTFSSAFALMGRFEECSRKF